MKRSTPAIGFVSHLLCSEYNSMFSSCPPCHTLHLASQELYPERERERVDSDVVTPNNIFTTSSCHTGYKLQEWMSLHQCVVWHESKALCTFSALSEAVVPAMRPASTSLVVWNVFGERENRLNICMDCMWSEASEYSHRSPRSMYEVDILWTRRHSVVAVHKMNMMLCWARLPMCARVCER